MQQAFPPGTLLTSKDGLTLMMVVGYAPTSPLEVTSSRRVQVMASSWEVWLLTTQWKLLTWAWWRLPDEACLPEDWDAAAA